MVAGITVGVGITIITVIGIKADVGPNASIRSVAQSSRRRQLGMHQKDL